MSDPRDAVVERALTEPATPMPTPAPTPTPPPTRAAAVDVDVDLDERPDTTPRPGSLARRMRHDIEGLSLRSRLVAVLVVALLVALTVTGYGVQAVLSRFLVGQIDDQLRTSYSRAVSDRFFVNGLVGEHGPPTAFATFLSVDGHPELSRTAVGRPDTPAPAFQPISADAAEATKGRIFSIAGPSGQAWRAVALPASYTTASGTSYPASVVLALPLQDVHRAVNQLRLVTLLVGLAVIGLCAGLGWLAIRRSFRPLIEMEETAAAIAAGDLSRRIPERPASTEVGRLTSSLNGMLTQIESAFRAREASEARTRRFAADASHELRTPLASIRGFAELFRQGAVPADEVPRTMRRIEDEAKRMGSLVEDLLLLARLDEQRPARHEEVDLAVLAGDAVHDAKGLDAERTVRLVGLGPGSGPAPARVTGDEDRLRQVVANLVGNAVRHTPPGTPVEVAVGRDAAGRAVLEVRDHGRGLSTEQADKVFERFYRLDSSRRRGQDGQGGKGGGSGLGLSIVAAVVAAHAGTVQVLTTPGGGATFRVELPARAISPGTGMAPVTAR